MMEAGKCKHGVMGYLHADAPHFRRECPECDRLREIFIEKHGGEAPVWFCERHRSTVRTVLCPECVEDDERDAFLSALPGRLEELKRLAPYYSVSNTSADEFEAIIDALIADLKENTP